MPFAEATGALDEQTETALYGSLMRACDCVISVGATPLCKRPPAWLLKSVEMLIPASHCPAGHSFVLAVRSSCYAECFSYLMLHVPTGMWHVAQPLTAPPHDAGHRMLLLQHHTHVLACGKNGVWTKHTSEEYRRVLAAAPGHS